MKKAKKSKRVAGKDLIEKNKGLNFSRISFTDEAAAVSNRVFAECMRSGMKIVTTVPKEYGKAVSMCTLKGRVLVAFEYAICEIVGRKIKKLQFERLKEVFHSGAVELYPSAFDLLKNKKSIRPSWLGK